MNVEGNDVVIRFSADVRQANKSIQTLTANLQKLKVAFASISDNSVKNLGDLVKALKSANSIQAKGLKESLNALKKLNGVSISATLTKNLKNLVSAISQLPEGGGKELRGVATGLGRLTKVGEIQVSDQTISNLRKLVNAVKDFPAGVGESIKELASSLRVLDAYYKQQEAQAKKQAEKQAAMRKGISASLPEQEKPSMLMLPPSGSELLGEVWENRGELISAVFTKIGDAAKAAAPYVKMLVGSISGLVSVGWNKLKSRVLDVAKGFKTLTSSIGRIAFYRAIRTAIKAVTQGFQEGIKNAYFWAKEVGNQFAASMDTIKTATNYMKNSLGAMVAPLLNSLAPAIDFIIDRFVDLLNIVNQVFALLGGQSTWFKALKYPAEYMEETAGATAKARKELKLWLASFDELNIIPNQNDTGRGGGAGDALDYGSMFEEVDLQNPLKEAIESGDWEGLGRLLAEKLNGLFDAVDFSGAGEKIGKLIGRAIDSVYGFMTTLNFTKIGQRFGELVGRAIANIDWKKVGALKVRKWTALIDLVIGFINKLDWKEVGKAFGDYFKGALEHLSDWLVSINWNQAGRDLVDDLVDFVNGLDLNTVFTNLGQALVNASSALWEFVKGIIQRLWEYIQYQIYLDSPRIAEFFGIQGEELAKKFGTKLTEGATYHTKVMVDGVGKVFRRGQETLGEESKKTVDAITKPWTINLPTAETSLRKTLNNVEGEIKDFGSQVDTVWLKKREMLLSVAIDKVSVPKFKVEYEDVSGVNLPVITARPHNIPMAYANGGFPEDGLFYANHGELVGKFNNGKTAVANNEQIIEGIKRGVAEGMSESGQGGNIYLQANLDGKVLFDAVCDRITDYFVQTGMTPFPV